MTDPAAKGERFIAVSGEAMSMLDIATVLKARLGDAAKKVPTRQLPNWLVRLVALFDPAHAAAASAARQHSQRDQREGRARARMEAAVTRGRDRRHRREPGEVRHRGLAAGRAPNMMAVRERDRLYACLGQESPS